MPEPLTNNWDDLLREGLLAPPADFHARIMMRVQQTSQTTQQALSPQPGRIRLALQALALTAAAIAGLTQLAIFSLGIWAATTAG